MFPINYFRLNFLLFYFLIKKMKKVNKKGQFEPIHAISILVRKKHHIIFF